MPEEQGFERQILVQQKKGRPGTYAAFSSGAGKRGGKLYYRWAIFWAM